MRSQVVDAGVAVRHLFGRPDDHKLVSSLTLFAAADAELDDTWTPLVTHAHEILDEAVAEGLPHPCLVTERFLAADARP